jgi:hypothetical protein
MKSFSLFAIAAVVVGSSVAADVDGLGVMDAARFVLEDVFCAFSLSVLNSRSALN